MRRKRVKQKYNQIRTNQQWEKLMAKDTAVRRIPVALSLSEVEDGFMLKATLPNGKEASQRFKAEHQLARTDQQAGITELLSKLGDTIFYAEKVEISFSQPWFIPRSLLAEWRRSVVELLVATRDERVKESSEKSICPDFEVPSSCFNFNISNKFTV